MCGRTACTLAPDDICKACGFTSQQKGGEKTKKFPKWQDPPGGQKYYQSYNVAPGSHTPILVSGKHFKPKATPKTETEETEGLKATDREETEVAEWVVQPMQWGLVPFWHSGEPKSVGYSMINARSDGMCTKRSFKVPLEKGRRCVVLVDGYFEWQTKDGKKQPYFLYFPHFVTTDAKDAKKPVQPEAKCEAVAMETDEDAQKRKRLLTLAGLFDVWHPKDGGEPLYSYSIITVPAHSAVSWLHERMPAVLNGEDEIRQWLDYESIPLKQATDLIRPVDIVSYHPVSSAVGNVKNKSAECIEEISLDKPKPTASSKFMAAWLSKGKSKKEGQTAKHDLSSKDADEDAPPLKKPKSEPQ